MERQLRADTSDVGQLSLSTGILARSIYPWPVLNLPLVCAWSPLTSEMGEAPAPRDMLPPFEVDPFFVSFPGNEACDMLTRVALLSASIPGAVSAFALPQPRELWVDVWADRPNPCVLHAYICILFLQRGRGWPFQSVAAMASPSSCTAQIEECKAEEEGSNVIVTSEHDVVRAVLSEEDRNGLTAVETREASHVLVLLHRHQSQYKSGDADDSPLHPDINCFVCVWGEHVGAGGCKQSACGCVQSMGSKG